MYRKPTARLIRILVLLLALGACERRDHLVEQHLLEFGTIIQITLITDDLNRAEGLLQQIETRLTSFRHQWHAWEESDLTRFNRALAKGEKIDIPRSLQALLNLSADFNIRTGGLFNPAMGKLIAAYGFHGRAVDQDLVEKIRQQLPQMTDLKINGHTAQSLNPHLQIDLGGIAKGYAIGWISDFLSQNGIEDFVVNAGGDLAISGNRFGKPWRIGIQNPSAPGVIAGISLSGKHSLFTSGNYLRQHWFGKKQFHHIIDPISGKPSQGQVSATVLMSDPVTADVAATIMMIHGMAQHDILSQQLDIRDFLLVSDKGELLSSRSMAEKLDFSTNLKVEIVN